MCFLAFLAAIVWQPGQANKTQAAGSITTVAGSTNGNFQVDLGGQAAYNVPIFVPPGRAGLQPQLSINYNSQSRAGYLGYGFQIGGIPRIHRCGNTEYLDNKVRGVQYDAADAYCLDGSRLVRLSGAHGADGAEYRTHQETFSRIKVSGSVSTVFDVNPSLNDSIGVKKYFQGPKSFIIEKKDGATLYFGTNENSRILAGNGQVNIWALEKVVDRHGNTMEFVLQ